MEAFERKLLPDGSGALSMSEVKLMIYSLSSGAHADPTLRKVYAQFYKNPVVVVRNNFEEGERNRTHRGLRGVLLKYPHDDERTPGGALQHETEYEVKLFKEDVGKRTCEYTVRFDDADALEDGEEDSRGGGGEGEGERGRVLLRVDPRRVGLDVAVEVAQPHDARQGR